MKEQIAKDPSSNLCDARPPARAAPMFLHREGALDTTAKYSDLIG
jgi:hypothetical protein